MRSAIRFHLEGEGEAAPGRLRPRAYSTWIDVSR
jgi:hypothetical protein